MKRLTTLRDAGSLLAGLLIGLSIVVMVFVMTVPDPGSTQTVLVIGASIDFALGLVLQGVVTRPRQQGTSKADLTVWAQAKLVASGGTRSVAGARRHGSRRQIAAFTRVRRRPYPLARGAGLMSPRRGKQYLRFAELCAPSAKLCVSWRREQNQADEVTGRGLPERRRCS